MSSSSTPKEEEEDEALFIVVQRISGGRLLVNEDDDKWVHLVNEPGLVNYVAFGRRKGNKSSSSEEEAGSSPSTASPITKDRMVKAAKSLLTCKLATASGWSADHSDAESLITLSKVTQRASLVTIPQASLVGKCIPGDKYMKYHHQVDKDRSEDLYHQWVDVLHEEALKLINPMKYDDKKKKGMEKYRRRAEGKLVNPKDMFKEGEYEGRYGKYDEEGFPLLLADGSDIPKSQVKKLTKMYNAQKRKWDVADKAGKINNENGNNNNNTDEDITQSNASIEAGRAELVEHQAPRVVENEVIIDEGDLGRLHMANGTFSGRQGWEMISTGPFTHQLVF
ncbi:hypothetical protein Pmar_PMAR022252 [Perkinsus marinus ATCC 50983]|uniref:Uncharacterized protein n=1 Tax=Perkinsus marinus (strain ATCC 50983 / TXsc) TaxID=423536 RepID=C5KDL3_PERM5|nr:hypothetical protein Pmar_PMAR022252 [Perkinsus marinus ATCC 50983]EER17316.1 hypothetical protein Pmar_PMAR022252 [Perkinsus marinus ATCC 50983]|eukprot:XP_002785520.1 hypothetical protein Pmar_PMAR022252 [Perkinsus marinus ATCC 50983]